MVWYDILFLHENQVSKAWFIYQQNLKKFKVSSLLYKPKYTKKIFKNPEHNNQI